MSNTHQFPNLPQSTWTCWQTQLVPELERRGCDSIQFSGGDSGTLSFHHSVPLTDGRFAFTYAYDPAGSVLTLTITDKPGLIPAQVIFSFVQGAIYSCPQ